MIREGFARRRVGNDGFRPRGQDVSRVEGFSDAVFAFAITLLVVSLEVPRTFDELLAAMRGFFAFADLLRPPPAPCGTSTTSTSGATGSGTLRPCGLNSILLFLVLFYVYPLKFLFTLLADQLLGFDEKVRLPGGASVEMIEPSQGPLLMVIYGGGFLAVQLVFVLLYLRAYSLRGALGLGAYELSVTREEIQGFLLNVSVAAGLGCRGRPRRARSGRAGRDGLLPDLPAPIHKRQGDGRPQAKARGDRYLGGRRGNPRRAGGREAVSAGR